MVGAAIGASPVSGVIDDGLDVERNREETVHGSVKAFASI